MKATIVEMGKCPVSDEVITLGKVEFPCERGVEEVYSVYSAEQGPSNGTFYITQTCARIQYELDTANDDEYDRLSKENNGLCGKTYNEMKAFLER
jgi:hypothetical protein